MVSDYDPGTSARMESLENQLADHRANRPPDSRRRELALYKDDSSDIAQRKPGIPIRIPSGEKSIRNEGGSVSNIENFNRRTLGSTRRPNLKKVEHDPYHASTHHSIRDQSVHMDPAKAAGEAASSRRRTYSIPAPETSRAKPRNVKRNVSTPQRAGFEGSKSYAGTSKRLTPKTHNNTTGLGRVTDAVKVFEKHAPVTEELFDFTQALNTAPSNSNKRRKTNSGATIPTSVQEPRRRSIKIAMDEEDDEDAPEPGHMHAHVFAQDSPLPDREAANYSHDPIEIDSDDDDEEAQDPDHETALDTTSTTVTEHAVRGPDVTIVPLKHTTGTMTSGTVARAKARTKDDTLEHKALTYPSSDDDEKVENSLSNPAMSFKGTQIARNTVAPSRTSAEHMPKISPYFQADTTVPDQQDLPGSFTLSDDDVPVSIIRKTIFTSPANPKTNEVLTVQDNSAHKFLILSAGGSVQQPRPNFAVLVNDMGFRIVNPEGEEDRRAALDYSDILHWTYDDTTCTLGIVLKKPNAKYGPSKQAFITLDKIEDTRFIRLRQTDIYRKLELKYYNNESLLRACRESCKGIIGPQSPLLSRARRGQKSPQSPMLYRSTPMASPATHPPRLELSASKPSSISNVVAIDTSNSDLSTHIYDAGIRNKSSVIIPLPQGRDVREHRDERHRLVDDQEVVIDNTLGMQYNTAGLVDVQGARRTRGTDQKARENAIRSAKSTEPLLIYPNIKGQTSVTLYEDDLDRLQPDEFLNDSIVEFYLKYNFDRLTEQQQADAHIFSTFFYHRLTQKKDKTGQDNGYEAVKKWTSKGKGIDLFSKRFVVIPINENLHWYLAVVVNLDKIEFGQDVVRKSDASFILPEGLDVTAASESDSRASSPSAFDTESLLGGLTNEEKAVVISEKHGLVEKSEDFIEETPPPTQTDTIVPTTTEPLNTASGADSPLRPSLTARIQEAERLKVPAQSAATKPADKVVNLESAEFEQLSLDDTPLPSPKDKRITNIKNGKQKRTSQNFSKPGMHISEDTPTIIILDSLGNSHPRVHQIIKTYLVNEAKDKKNEILNPAQFATCKADVPPQDNYSDCGLFLIQYVDTLLKDPGIVKSLLNKVKFPTMEGQQAHKREFKNKFGIDRIPLRRKEMIEQIRSLSGPFRKQAREQEQRRLEEREKAKREAKTSTTTTTKEAEEDLAHDNSCSILPDDPALSAVASTGSLSPAKTGEQGREAEPVVTATATATNDEKETAPPQNKVLEQVKSPGKVLNEDSIDELDFL